MLNTNLHLKHINMLLIGVDVKQRSRWFETMTLNRTEKSNTVFKHCQKPLRTQWILSEELYVRWNWLNESRHAGHIHVNVNKLSWINPSLSLTDNWKHVAEHPARVDKDLHPWQYLQGQAMTPFFKTAESRINQSISTMKRCRQVSHIQHKQISSPALWVGVWSILI